MWWYNSFCFWMIFKSLSAILISNGIETFPDREGNILECRNFFDDWFLFAVAHENDHVYGLLKMREQEYDLERGIQADGDTPGVTVSFVAFDADGAYLASSPTAFPGHITEYKLLPALSSGTVYCDRYEVEPYPCFHVKVRGFNRRTVDLAKRIAMTLSEAGECGVSDIARALKKKLPKNELLQAYTVTYIALEELLRSGVIVAMQTEDAREELVAPKTVFKRSI